MSDSMVPLSLAATCSPAAEMRRLFPSLAPEAQHMLLDLVREMAGEHADRQQAYDRGGRLLAMGERAERLVGDRLGTCDPESLR